MRDSLGEQQSYSRAQLELSQSKKKDTPKPPKNRDLLNPNKKRRKLTGAKFGNDLEEGETMKTQEPADF